MNEKNEIRDGWYKIKSQQDMDKGHKLCSGVEDDLPKHRIIKIVDGRWHGWLIPSEVLLHEWFEYGEVVYVRDLDSQEWKKAKYHGYSHRSSSQLAEVSGCAAAWSYCISEAEWKKKYEKHRSICVYNGFSLVVNTPIHNNEQIIIMRCGDNITYETEKINN